MLSRLWTLYMSRWNYCSGISLEPLKKKCVFGCNKNKDKQITKIKKLCDTPLGKKMKMKIRNMLTLTNDPMRKQAVNESLKILKVFFKVYHERLLIEKFISLT